MKLNQLQEARYASNFYGTEWCNENGDCSGFVGPTQAKIGKYQITGEANDMFKPDYSTYKDTAMGFLEVAATLDEVRERMKYGMHHWEVQEFKVSDDSRSKFGALIGKSSDIEYYKD